MALDDAGVAAVAGDLIFVRAYVRDKGGRTVPTFNGTAHFEANGDFAIVGDREVPVEAGIGSALVRVARANPHGTIAARLENGLSGELAKK